MERDRTYLESMHVEGTSVITGPKCKNHLSLLNTHSQWKHNSENYRRTSFCLDISIDTIILYNRHQLCICTVLHHVKPLEPKLMLKDSKKLKPSEIKLSYLFTFSA